jgi:S-adenosylmethionine:tRNA ribosyltransferase-isomerase
MLTSDFDYALDEKLIAQVPAEPRDSSRLMVYDRGSGETVHTVFNDITGWLHAGDVLVINETKVIPARLYGKKRGGSCGFEFLLLKQLSAGRWEVIMRPGKRLRPGQYVDFADGFSAKLLEKKPDGVCEVVFEYSGDFYSLLDRYGKTPLPPYISSGDGRREKERYQTVYAKKEGSAAAPTAGLHFTDGLMEKLEAKGVIIARILLHVGLGTFRPVKEEVAENHIMHSEYYEISGEAADKVNLAKNEGRRVVAVGTTSVRALESGAGDDGRVSAGGGETDIFIYPGYRFKAVDALVTNFHLPKSTLLMLVCAFAGKEETLGLYNEAVRLDYRFFSFGDAMLVV